MLQEAITTARDLLANLEKISGKWNKEDKVSAATTTRLIGVIFASLSSLAVKGNSFMQ